MSPGWINEGSERTLGMKTGGESKGGSSVRVQRSRIPKTMVFWMPLSGSDWKEGVGKKTTGLGSGLEGNT